MDNTTKQQIKENFHFKGKKGFYFEDTAKGAALSKAIDTAIKQEETRQALAIDNFRMELPQAAREEKAQIELAVIEEILKQKGATKEDIQSFMKTAAEIAEELIAEHEEHVKNDFRVIK